MSPERPSDLEVERLFAEYQANPRRSARNRIVEQTRGLAEQIARGFTGRGVEADDLRQVALLGLVKAVERFDPDRGVPFGAFARRTIEGELKRWLRDHAWAVRPPRPAQERHLRLGKAVEGLSQRLGRSPTVRELALELDATEDEVLEAMEAGAAYRANSLDAPAGGDRDREPVGDRLAENDPRFQRAELRVVVAELLTRLAPREAEIVRLRFYEELSQSEIAERIGISQMHVSRLLRRTLVEMRDVLGPQRGAVLTELSGEAPSIS
jgi:RNA polymerase sigma-B factor